MAFIHASARLGIALIWAWQGLMPKLLFPSHDERSMMTAAGLPVALLPWIGVLELAFAAATIAFWRWRPFFLLNALAMGVALAVVALSSPSYLVAAFNPFALNMAMILLSLIGYLAASELPSASRCLRNAPKETQ
jgi:DoxX-like protein